MKTPGQGEQKEEKERSRRRGPQQVLPLPTTRLTLRKLLYLPEVHICFICKVGNTPESTLQHLCVCQVNNVEEAHSREFGGWWGVHASFGSDNNTIAQTAPEPHSSRGKQWRRSKQRGKSMPGTSSASMTLPRVVSRDMHISVMNK